MTRNPFVADFFGGNLQTVSQYAAHRTSGLEPIGGKRPDPSIMSDCLLHDYCDSISAVFAQWSSEDSGCLYINVTFNLCCKPPLDSSQKPHFSSKLQFDVSFDAGCVTRDAVVLDVDGFPMRRTPVPRPDKREGDLDPYIPEFSPNPDYVPVPEPQHYEPIQQPEAEEPQRIWPPDYSPIVLTPSRPNATLKFLLGAEECDWRHNPVLLSGKGYVAIFSVCGLDPKCIHSGSNPPKKVHITNVTTENCNNINPIDIDIP